MFSIQSEITRHINRKMLPLPRKKIPSVEINPRMIQILQLVDKELKTAIINMLKDLKYIHMENTYKMRNHSKEIEIIIESQMEILE